MTRRFWISALFLVLAQSCGYDPHRKVSPGGIDGGDSGEAGGRGGTPVDSAGSSTEAGGVDGGTGILDGASWPSLDAVADVPATLDAERDSRLVGAGGSGGTSGLDGSMPMDASDAGDVPVPSGGAGGTDAPKASGGAGGGTSTGGGLGAGGMSGSGGVGAAPGGGGGASGGTNGSGGAVSAGGASGGVGSGGSVVSSGGIVSSGGAPLTGGAPGTGGAAANGGASSAGGATSAGGVPGSGGVTANGGATSAGGTTSAGGAPGTGGANGGAPGTGGSSSGQRYTLTVSFANAGPAGTVVIQPGDQTCVAPTTCSATFDPGTAITLTAKPTNTGATVTSILTGWTGACAGNGPLRTCSLTMNADTSTAARFDTLSANLVFVTSASYAGDLGSALAYQNKCNELASAAGINNASNDAYIAWIAASNYNPVTLLGASRGWVRMDLLPWIDDMPTALSTGAVLYPAAYDENGQRVIRPTWAGMHQDGSPADNCNDWTNASNYASHGFTHAGGYGWYFNNVGVSSCGGPWPVLCLMKGRSTAVAATPVPGKKIYISRSAWVPSGGINAADAKCLAEAPSGVVSAKAVLVASTRALADVLNASTVYVRPDGVKAGTGAEIVSAISVLSGLPPASLASIESAVIQDGSGSYEIPAGMVWTGITYNGTPDKATCRDWTSSDSTDSGTAGAVATGWEAAGNDASPGCNSHIFLQCAEQ